MMLDSWDESIYIEAAANTEVSIIYVVGDFILFFFHVSSE